MSAISEIKCQSCGNWTPGGQLHCVHCGALVDPGEIDRKARKVRAEAQRAREKAAETKLEKFIKRLRKSENPFHRFVYHVLNIIWMIYMGIVSFVIWFTAIFSG